MQPPSPRLSVVIPAYNEETRIGPTLETIHRHLTDRGLPFEILVVDDGSGDKTGEAVQSFADRWPGVRLLRNPGNRGKGYSVRHGMGEGAGEVLLFSDADLSTPIEETEKMLQAHARGADVV
ncbi:MAG: glycosyltransferase, partial [Planctomycetota bacterium]